MNAWEHIQEQITKGALIVGNNSGGKDSQLLTHLLGQRVPTKQLVIIHAELPEADWPDATEHAERHAKLAGAHFIVARARKTFLEMVDQRFEKRPEVPSFPSAATRQCTSDLKRGPIEREIRRYAKANSFSIVVNCMGMRAAESSNRAKLVTWKKNENNSIAGREWFDALPIHELTTEEVFTGIKAAGQEPHPAYSLGNDRFSCMWCIYGSVPDLQNAAIAHPKVYAKFVGREKRTGYKLHMSRKSLEQLTGIKARVYLPILEAA